MVAAEKQMDDQMLRIEIDDWSDPLIAMQVSSFRDYVANAVQSGHTNTAEKVEKTAEYLCEWSRNLLNRMFGRTTGSELVLVQQLFESAANSVDQWASKFPDAPQQPKIRAYSEHIRERTGLKLVH